MPVSWPKTSKVQREIRPLTQTPAEESKAIIGSITYTAIALRLCYLQISTPEFYFHRLSGGSSNADPVALNSQISAQQILSASS
jgi:hypothetical protein